jgi:hypothetical protein
VFARLRAIIGAAHGKTEIDPRTRETIDLIPAARAWPKENGPSLQDRPANHAR